jgi:hypothetical protein
MRDDNYGNKCQDLQYILSELLSVQYLNFSRMNVKSRYSRMYVELYDGYYLFIHSFKDCVKTSLNQTICLQRLTVI